ncbi:hypothetical protein M440DRAFT_1098649 [Trichoderma longibrachiatum ATCC 18648]|uniref:Uncharacterized protein n=1 Tax=Trichoderma longibrachiatum ATCC 18648 TaxID=983965 RepID=A0A2T4BRZ6_TRILO|nr:hypothetical protein M440DRAFT_1098649 [Trichoderma longibrachiatum ATCC 18648]
MYVHLGGLGGSKVPRPSPAPAPPAPPESVPPPQLQMTKTPTTKFTTQHINSNGQLLLRQHGLGLLDRQLVPRLASLC